VQETTTIKPLITITDAIMWQAFRYMSNAVDPHSTAQAKTDTLKLLAEIPNELVRGNYLDNICKQYKWKATDSKKQLAGILEQRLPSRKPYEQNEDDVIIEDPEKFPKWAKPYFQQWKDEGFISCNAIVKGKKQVGFYGITVKNNDDGSQNYTTVQHSNFIAEPMMHVYNGPESLFIFRLTNHKTSPIIEVPAMAIPTPDLFQKYCIGEGNFMIYCNSTQWKRIASSLMERFTKCVSIPFLGWQQDGFFAFVNGAYIPGSGWQQVTDNGTITFNKEQFLIPASSNVYLKAVGRNTDAYEMDRPLAFHPGAVSFKDWANQMYLVYGEKGLLAIASIPMALFRDLVFDVDNNCPLLYAFGEPSSGKSKYAESINAVFYRKRMAFNVNSGTDHAFFSYLQRFINTISWLNEVDEATLKPEWFQALKGAYDGESRERGRIVAGKLKTEIQKILGLIILTGQKLITADDNSLVTRALIEGFSKEENRTDEQVNNYNTLKGWEADGLTHLLTEILQHRAGWKEVYKDAINEQLGNWRHQNADARNANQRILQNWAHAAVNYSILQEFFPLPVTALQFTEYCLKQATRWSKFITTSDVLSEFWATVQNLVNTKQIKEGWDYIISNEVSVMVGDDKKQLQEPSRVLFLRLNNVHPLYEADSRKRGKNPMSKENLFHYFSSRKYFIGAVRSKKFYRYDNVARSTEHGSATTSFQRVDTVASCHAFLYESINIEITTEDEDLKLPI